MLNSRERLVCLLVDEIEKEVQAIVEEGTLMEANNDDEESVRQTVLQSVYDDIQRELDAVT